LTQSRKHALEQRLAALLVGDIRRALEAEDGLLAQAVAASEKDEEAGREVAEAEHELDLFVNNPKLMSVIGEQNFVEGVEVRQQALDEARRALADISSQSELAAELSDGDLLRAWPTLSVSERRRLMHGLLDRVVITRATGRGRHAEPIGERTQIMLRGNVLLTPVETASNSGPATVAQAERDRRAPTAMELGSTNGQLPPYDGAHH
jgi:hypothetical protein